MLAVSEAADAAIRKQVEAAWVPNSTYADKVKAMADLNAPMGADAIAVLKRSMLEAYKASAAYARRKVKQAKASRRKAKVQEFRPTAVDIIRAKVQELEADEVAYDQIKVEYAAWVSKLGTEMWQDKVRAAQGAMTEAIEKGYSLNPISHYENSKGEFVSAFEATAGKGGAGNVLDGFKFVQESPGLMNNLNEALSKWGYSGYQTERVARTEYARSMNEGMLSVYLEDSAIVAFEWVSAREWNTCQECAMLHGTVFDKDDPRLDLYSPPAHCNCLCELLPVFTWEYDGSNIDEEKTITMYGKDEEPFIVTYVPSRIDPDFLNPIKRSSDADQIKAQLLTQKQADAYRKGFEPKSGI